ncbi:MAG TPA: MOSC domain-containing protein [Burkholderiales bacterium]|nr:MOSC domain-containing protein [Burkholderiales bacterium]
MNPDSDLAKLMSRFPHAGRVEWLGVRPRYRAALVARPEVEALADFGLQGDHYGKAGGRRQVTLIQAEQLEAVAKMLGRPAIPPEWVRRNILVSGINVLALRERRFRVGQAVLEGTGECAPCSRMEEALGIGGYNAMRGHGGITARILAGGVIRVGDPVEAQ